MIIGGLQKNSLIDYPGKISCVFFLAGCNFDCPYCHNPEIIKKEYKNLFDEKMIYNFLETHKWFLDGVVISGGEPTLQKDLPEFCEKIKKMGYPIKLDTNGSRPKMIQFLVNHNLIDYIAMDIKTEPCNYSPLIQKNCNSKNILSSIHIIMNSNIPYEFKTTCIKPLVHQQVIENISKLISGSKLYALQQFHNTAVLHPDFFQDNKRIYSDDELMDLKSIAQPWVEQCIVR